MGSTSIERNKLAEGLEVIVSPQNDRTRKQRITGRIAEFLTNAQSHTHGILVRLDNGVVGRVKDITDESPKVLPVKDKPSSPTKDDVNLIEIIAKGENHFAEFKSSALWSERHSQEQIKSSNSAELKQYGRNASKIIIAKTVAGFLNTDGGTLVIGVKENKEGNEDEVIGIESEFSKLKDPCADGYRRKIIDAIIKPYFPNSIFNHFNNYLQILFEEMDGRVLCFIKTIKSDQKVFLKLNGQDYFFIRVDASTRQLIGEEIVDYCVKRFG